MPWAWEQAVLLSLVALNGLIFTQCCPSNCVICLTALFVCNKYNSEQDLSGKYTILTINDGAFVNADFVTLLDVSASSVTSIEDGAFQGLDSLKELYLNQNSITSLQDNVFSHMPVLETLDLSANSISSIESNAFHGLKALKHLHLSGNQLFSLPDDLFSPLISLQTLDLSDNDIASLNPNSFTGLGNLTNLKLNKNSLTEISDTVLTSLLYKLPSLKQISISGNEWHCNCNITNIIKLINTVSVPDNSSVRCNSPNELKNDIITQLNLYQEPLICYEVIPSPSPSPLLPYMSPSPSPEDVPLPSPTPSILFTTTTSSTITPTSTTITPILSSSSSSSIYSPSISSLPPSSSSSLTSSTTSSSIIISTLPSVSPSSPSTPSATTIIATATTSSSVSIKPFPTLSSITSTTSRIAPPSPPSTSTTSSSQTLSISITPSPSCMGTSVETTVGVTEWEDTNIEDTAMTPCPFGPSGNIATRICLRTPDNEAVWGEVQTGGCLKTENYLQLLLNQLTAENALENSAMLLQLPFNQLTQDDITLLVEIFHALTAVAGDNNAVLVNVFVAIDLALEGSKGNPLSTESSRLLQETVNTALFKIVSMGNQEVIFDLNNFFLGGKDIENIDRVEALAILGGDDAGLQFVKNTTEAPERNVAIEYDKEGMDVHLLQVTVYTNNTLYTEGCVEGVSLCDGEVVSPVTVVTTDNGTVGSVNVTFDVSVTNGSGNTVCAVWNATSNGGIGEWEVSVCRTIYLSSPPRIMCECHTIGAVALIQVYDEILPCVQDCDNNNNITIATVALPVRVWFTLACGISTLLHCQVVIVSLLVCCKHEFVRNIQALLNQGIAESLLYVMLAVSLGNDYIYEVCLGVGSIVHYLIIVCFMWLLLRPVVLLMSLIRRNLYERDCFILPFVFIAWSVPVIPVSVYGVLTFTTTNMEDSIDSSCWLESFIFPGYFTFLCTAFCGSIALCLVLILAIMAISGYTISEAGYAQLFQILAETVLFCVMIVMYFVSSVTQSDTSLFITGAVVLLNGVYFFVSNALIRAKIRNTMFCKDTSFKDTGYKNPHLMPSSISSSATSVSSQPTNTTTLPHKFVRQFQRIDRNGAASGGSRTSPVDFGMDYISDHIHHQYRYPLNMWDHVGGGGKVRKSKRSTSNRGMRGAGRGGGMVRELGSSDV